MANIPLKTITFPELDNTYTVTQVDDTLKTAGAAADAAETGRKIGLLKADLQALEGGGLTADIKSALLACFNHVVWDDDDPTGQTYIDTLEDALYPPAELVVENTLVNCSTSNNSASVTRGGAYSATITPSSGCSLYEADIVITMGGVDITNTAYSNGTISIASVTGDLSITVTCYATIQWDKSKGRVPSSSDGIATTNTGIENSDMTEAFDSDKGIVVTGTGSHLLRYDVAGYQYIKKGTFEITFTVDSMANDSNINLRLTKDGTNGSNMAVMRTAAKGYHIRYTKATSTSIDTVVKSFNLNQEYTLKVDFDYNSNGKIIVYLDGTKIYETTTQSSYYANRNALIFTYTLKVYVKSFRWIIKEGTLNE